MVMDENRFFRDVTLNICGSLEIEKALGDCFDLLREMIPLESAALATYDPVMRISSVLAIATGQGGELSTVQSRQSQAAHDKIMGWYRSRQFEANVRQMDSIRQDDVIAPVTNKMNVPDSSAMQMFLKLQGKMLGSLVLIRGAISPYSGEQVRLLSLLNEPFAIALSNYLRFQELNRLKELLEDDSRYFQEELKRKAGAEVVGAEFGLKPVIEQVRQVAPLNSPVLLLGETGTGKEVIANLIHNLSNRRNGPFIQVNCGAIPDTLIDSELFGHVKGAFTGASFQRRGRFERAHGGTIFLDEIGELPPEAQVRLLRVLQERYIERVGGDEPVDVDIRIIAATHKDLLAMLGSGQFREDLYYRLRVFPINIPPLRQRRTDIPSLAHYFIQKKSIEMGIEDVPIIDSESLPLLMSYDWPGNVRELENTIERALILRKGGLLDFSELGAGFTLTPGNLAPHRCAALEGRADNLILDDVIAGHIRRVLDITGGKIHGPDGAAGLMAINPSTLRNKMKKLGIPFGRKWR